jgi:hypothetical protein
MRYQNFLPRAYSGREVRLNTHLCLVQEAEKEWSYTSIRELRPIVSQNAKTLPLALTCLENKVKIKVKSTVCLIKYDAMRTYGEVVL